MFDSKKKFEFRELKRDIKRAGNRKRRRFYQKELTTNPEETHWSEFDYGRFSSEKMNGVDIDKKRNR